MNESREIQILQAVYWTVEYLDLETGQYKRTEFSGQSPLKIPRSGNFEEDSGRICDELIDERDQEIFRNNRSLERLRRNLSNPEGPVQEYYRYRIRGQGSWIEECIVYVRNCPVPWVGILDKDATGQIRDKKMIELQNMALKDALDIAENANSAKSDFLSRMSHDIRTPLNAIMGLAAIADRYVENAEKVVECLAKIQTSSQHLLGLVNDVLDMSKIESGKITLEYEPFSLRRMLENVLTIIRPLVREREHQLEVQTQALEHEWVMGDEMRLQQLFVNLLSNAVKFTDHKGKIGLVIEESQARYRDYGFYRFTVSDNGIGMSAEFQKKLFQPFERAENVGGREGTGLGMVIVKTIVEMMNGHIEVESEEGKGTVFTVSMHLRLQPQEEQKTCPEPPEKSENLRRLQDKKILLVEDNALNREIALEFLKDTLARVECAQDGRQAVEMVKQNEYDLILMDIQMPVMDGYEASRSIRALPGREEDKLPILAMTANAFAEDVRKAREAGMNDHITKPIDPHLLNRMVSHWLS